MSDHDLLIERLGWTPDQIIIKRRGEVGAEIPGWTASGMAAETETYYSPGQPRDRRGRWMKGFGGAGIGAVKAPMGADPKDLRAVNPGYGHHFVGASRNCQVTTAAYELRQRGLKVRAVANHVGDGMDKGGFMTWWRDPKNPGLSGQALRLSRERLIPHGAPSFTTQREVADFAMKNWPEGARGYVRGTMWDSNGDAWNSHIFNWENKPDGKVEFVDAQIAKIYEPNDLIWQNLMPGTVTLARLDDLEPIDDINKAVRPEGTEITRAELGLSERFLGLESPPQVRASAITETFYPGQPRDRRGRWTKGMGGYLGPSSTKAWVEHVKLEDMTEAQKAEVQAGLLKAAGRTSRIPLDSVRAIGRYEALQRYGYEAESIVGGYTSPRTGLSEPIDVHSDTILLTPSAFRREFVDDAHVAGVKGLNSGRNWEVPTPGETNGLHVTIAHEVGHAAYYGLDEDQKFDVEDRLAREAGMGYSELMGGFEPMKVAAALSVYATSNTSEAIAEAWCEYTLSDSPRPPAVAVGSYMEGVYK